MTIGPAPMIRTVLMSVRFGISVRSVRSRHTGDLYCKAVVETPVNLSTEQRELLEKFEATFVGEGARRHSPRASTFLDGVKGFWDRMVS